MSISYVLESIMHICDMMYNVIPVNDRVIRINLSCEGTHRDF